MTVSTVTHKMMALVAAFALLLSAFPMQVIGAPDDDDKKVTYCKKNQSGELSFNSQSSAIKSLKNGIADSGINGDIVPPTEPDYPDGLNWDIYYGDFTGQQIWNNGCVVPTVTPDPGLISVTKVVDNGTNTETKLPSDFPLFITLDNGTPQSVTSGLAKTNLTPGVYTVTETNLPNYVATFSGDCDSSGRITLGAGEFKLCTVTNTYVEPVAEKASLTITKEVVSTVGLTGWSFDFSGDAGAFTLTNSTTSQTFTDISVGSYTVTEAAVANWALTNVTCDATFATTTNGLSLTLADGDDVTCTFTNTFTEPTTNPIPGCTDATANNYNAAATVDDGSCTYTAPQCIAANLLINPSFEEPVITGSYEQLSSIPGWTATNDVEIWRNLQGGASDGAQNVELDVVTGTTMSQMVTTTPGATYLVSYDFSARNGRPLADNEMDVLVDTAVEQSVALDGTGQVTNTWKPYWFTFDATGTSTDVAFAYSGTENGYGSLLDNAVVCLVEEAPVLGCTDPLATNYDAAATQDDGSCVLPPPAPNACTVTIMSDETNTVTEKSGAFAQALSFVHPAWTAVITGAAWIWGDDPVADSAVEETQTFVKEFFWNGTSTSAVLDIASDNGYTVTLNGTLFGGDAAENNFALATQDTHDLNALMQQGTNTLMIAVTNLAGSANPASNPAGLLYSMTVTGTTEIDCTAEPVMEPTPTRRSGGGGVLTSRPRTPDLPEPTPEVAGEAVSNIPEPQVLGEQVSIVPVGAPATGKGGATAVTFAVGQLLAVPRRFNRN